MTQTSVRIEDVRHINVSILVILALSSAFTRAVSRFLNGQRPFDQVTIYSTNLRCGAATLALFFSIRNERSVLSSSVPSLRSESLLGRMPL